MSPLVVLAIPVGGADRPRVRDADRRVRRDPAHARAVRGDLPVRDHAPVPLLGDVLPDRDLPPFLQALAWLTPLYHGVVLARGLSLGTIGEEPTIELAAVHLGILVAFAVVGAVFMVRTVSGKLIRG